MWLSMIVAELWLMISCDYTVNSRYPPLKRLTQFSG